MRLTAQIFGGMMVSSEEVEEYEIVPLYFYFSKNIIPQEVMELNTVEPIKDMNLIHDIADYLKEKSDRDYMMFLFGIYTGLRISDILKLHVRDVRGKDYVKIREKKTGKERRFPINAVLKKQIGKYVYNRRDYQYMFQSRQGNNRPISRQRAYSIIRTAGEAFGVEHLGTHTLRKTFGYHMYQQTKDAITIQKILNHASVEITMRYIGVTQDTMDTAMKNLNFET